MGLLDLASNPSVRWSQSEMPDAHAPLKLDKKDAAQLLSEHEMALKSQSPSPPKRTLTTPLQNGYAGTSSRGDKAYLQLHTTEKWPEPANDGDAGDAIFSGSNVRYWRNPALNPEPQYDGNLSEEDVLAEMVLEIASRHGDTTIEAVVHSLAHVAQSEGMSLMEVASAVLDEIEEPAPSFDHDAFLEERRTGLLSMVKNRNKFCPGVAKRETSNNDQIDTQPMTRDRSYMEALAAKVRPGKDKVISGTITTAKPLKGVSAPTSTMPSVGISTKQSDGASSDGFNKKQRLPGF